MGDASLYTIGGTVQAGEGAYITRAVDNDLLELCRSGEFSFVLTARQMGKSSLMVRTAQRLAEDDVRSVIIDLSQIGVRLSPEAWYLGILTNIEDALDLDTEIYEWWESHAQLGHAQRFTRFLQEIVLEEVEESIVVFMDEIDTTLSLGFTDDFFAAIRYVHNARSQVPEFRRLSFVLLGVATPSDLIGDATRTPFNIGHRVDVDYFTREEALPLASGLGSDPESARDALGWVLDWTSGHPYLTQRLCYALAGRHESRLTRDLVDETVTATFFGDRAEQDNNLRFVNDMLTLRSEDPIAVLGIYREVVRGKTVSDDPQSQPITHLKLSGVVAAKAGVLKVRNRIYATIFDLEWIRDRWPEHWIKSIPKPVLGLVAASFVAVILGGLAFTALRERTQQARFNEELSVVNDSLVAANALSDSLRAVTEAVNVDLSAAVDEQSRLRGLEAEANANLQNQISISEVLRQQTADANDLLQAEVETSNQLRLETQVANDSLLVAEARADSLRQVAEQRVADAAAARRETLVLGLATTALRQVRQGDPELAALLARQALGMTRGGTAEYLDPVHDALTQSLNDLDGSGGPEIDTGFDSGVLAVARGRNGSTVAGTETGTVVLHTVSGSLELDGHDGPVRAAAISADGSRIATAGYDGRVLVHTPNGEGTRELATHDGGAWAVSFSPDGQQVASAGADGAVRIRSLASEAARDLTPNDGIRVTGVAFSPDGGILVASGEDGTLWRLDASGNPDVPEGWGSGHPRINAVAFSPDGLLLATGGNDGVVRIWETASWTETRTLRAHVGPVNALAFSRDGRRFASGSSDHSVAVWNDGFEQNPILLQGHDSWVMSLAFSPDGRSLTSGSTDGSTRTWTVETAVLADRVCVATGRELTPLEWTQYVGEDFDSAAESAPCSALGEREP